MSETSVQTLYQRTAHVTLPRLMSRTSGVVLYRLLIPRSRPRIPVELVSACHRPIASFMAAMADFRKHTTRNNLTPNVNASVSHNPDKSVSPCDKHRCNLPDDQRSKSRSADQSMPKILVVEDGPVIALGREDSLRLEGYEFEVVADGARARTVLKTRSST